MKYQTNNGGHPSEDALELFCLNRLGEREAAPIEEHLLFCEPCQQRAAELDRFLFAAKQAALELRQEQRYQLQPSEPWWKAWLRPRFAVPAFGGAFALAMAFLTVGPHLRPDAEPQSLTLGAFRGEELAPAARAGVPVTLTLDLKGAPTENCCLLELVDETGQAVAQGSGEVSGGATHWTVKPLSQGQYFVRVYGRDKQLRREVALSVR